MAHHLPARLSLTQIRSVLITCDGCVDDEEGKSKVYRDAFHGLLVEVIFHMASPRTGDLSACHVFYSPVRHAPANFSRKRLELTG